MKSFLLMLFFVSIYPRVIIVDCCNSDGINYSKQSALISTYFDLMQKNVLEDQKERCSVFDCSSHQLIKEKIEAYRYLFFQYGNVPEGSWWNLFEKKYFRSLKNPALTLIQKHLLSAFVFALGIFSEKLKNPDQKISIVSLGVDSNFVVTLATQFFEPIKRMEPAIIIGIISTVLQLGKQAYDDYQLQKKIYFEAIKSKYGYDLDALKDLYSLFHDTCLRLRDENFIHQNRFKRINDDLSEKCFFDKIVALGASHSCLLKIAPNLKVIGQYINLYSSKHHVGGFGSNKLDLQKIKDFCERVNNIRPQFLEQIAKNKIFNFQIKMKVVNCLPHEHAPSAKLMQSSEQIFCVLARLLYLKKNLDPNINDGKILVDCNYDSKGFFNYEIKQKNRKDSISSCFSGFISSLVHKNAFFE